MVGAGPIGLVLAIDLARCGVSVQLIERNATCRQLPKMERCNARTMEMFRRMGLVERARAASTPPTTVAALSAEMAAILKLPDVRERIVLLGMDPRGSTPAGLAELDEGELKRWQPIVAASGFKVE